MKRIVRLTESDLTRIVKKTISEIKNPFKREKDSGISDDRKKYSIPEAPDFSVRYKNSLDDEYLHVWGPVPRPMYITNTGEGTYLLHIPNVFDDEEFDSIDDALIAAQESWNGRQGEKSFASQLMKHKMNQMR
jgi:hypothetical protein